MKSVQDTYLGWEELTHRKGCAKSGFEVSVRRNDDARRYHSGLAHEDRVEHGCKDGYCGHRNTFSEMVVRIVCRSCGAAEVITGEQTDDTGRTTTSTRQLGYGLPPRRLAGLLLWPGDPWLSVGRAVSSDPFDFLVTRTGVKHITEPDVVGQITQGRGKLGGVMWTACAVPNQDGPYGTFDRIRWAQVRDGFKTPAAAAKWITIELDAVSGTGGAG
ncbi:MULTISPECIES: hypothetical protein [Streptomyces]|uniref:hypothetical protein n=1 Tax=Streptomyces TaxID=1883 RepID=UPI00324F1EED